MLERRNPDRSDIQAEKAQAERLAMERLETQTTPPFGVEEWSSFTNSIRI